MRRAAALLLLAGLVPAGCGGERPAPAPVPVAWRESALPADGAIMLRDAAACGGSWLVVGALRDDAGGTRPALWASTDGTTWQPRRMHPRTFYGEQNVLSAVTCRAGAGAAVGAKSGGMHGNPRVSSWRAAGGDWAEVPGEFQLFGGPDAVNVGRVAAGPRGFLITGNRVSGAAVWRSPDASAFTLVEGAPGLASDAAGATWAYDGVAAPGGWLVVGAVRPPGRTDRDALGWRSADGSAWSRVPVAGGPGPAEMQRVAVSPAGRPLAAGVAGDVFRAWRLDGDAWRPAGSFGAVRRAGIAAVTSLTAVGDRWFAMASDGVGYGLWMSSDDGAHWAPVVLPALPAPGAQTTALVAGDAARLLLIVDDGTRGRLLSAPPG